MSDLTNIRNLHWGSKQDHHLSQTLPQGKCGSMQQKNHRSPHLRSPAGSRLLVVAQTAPLMMTPPPCPPFREEGLSHLGPPLPAPGSYPLLFFSLPLALTATSSTNTGDEETELWINYSFSRGHSKAFAIWSQRIRAKGQGSEVIGPTKLNID